MNDTKLSGSRQPAAVTLRGPWVAVLADNFGNLYASLDDIEDSTFVEIAVVRGTAVPVASRGETATRRPPVYDDADVLYEINDFDLRDHLDDARARWEQARAVATALTAFVPHWPHPAGPDELIWVAAKRRGIQAHRYAAGDQLTPCGRNQLAFGTTATAADAVAFWRVEWSCGMCWPPPPEPEPAVLPADVDWSQVHDAVAEELAR